MKKKILLSFSVIIIVTMLVDYFIDTQISETMDIVLKNSDIEIVDSFKLSAVRIAYIYENRQIINGGNTRFVVIGENGSCSLKDKEILLQDSGIEAFLNMKNDTLFIISSMQFKDRIIDKYIFSYMNIYSDTMRRFLQLKNQRNVIVECE